MHGQRGRTKRLAKGLKNKKRPIGIIYRNYSTKTSVSHLDLVLSNLTSLESRRTVARLTLFHNFYYNMQSFMLTHCKSVSYISLRHDHSLKIAPIFGRTNRYKYSPLALSIKNGNSLPNDIVTEQNDKKYSAKNFWLWYYVFSAMSACVSYKLCTESPVLLCPVSVNFVLNSVQFVFSFCLLLIFNLSQFFYFHYIIAFVCIFLPPSCNTFERTYLRRIKLEIELDSSPLSCEGEYIGHRKMPKCSLQGTPFRCYQGIIGLVPPNSSACPYLPRLHPTL